MAKFNEYPSKATPEDADTLMLYDATSKSNKLSPFSGIWNWMVNKLTNAVINNLQTNNKTVLGAINELNSNSFRVIISSSSPTVENIIDSQITGGIMLIYGTTGAGTKQGLPADGCVWIGIAVAATEHTFSSLYLFGNNHVYAKAKTEGKWRNYVTVA